MVNQSATTSYRIDKGTSDDPGRLEDLFENSSPNQARTGSRSHESIVRQIAASIRDGQLGKGDRLPTERELSASFGVGRGVIREAIKVLSAVGFVEARQGSGIFVLSSIPTVSRAFTLSVSPDAVSIERLFEFRRVLEVEAARLAARHRSNEHIAEIAGAVEATASALESGDWDEFTNADNAFHSAVARAGGNPFLEVSVASTREVQLGVVTLIADRAGSVRSAFAHHCAIAEAISRQKPDEAAQRMADHIAYSASTVKQRLSPDSAAQEFQIAGEGSA